MSNCRQYLSFAHVASAEEKKACGPSSFGSAIILCAVLLSACGSTAKVPPAGPQAVAWIDAYIEAIQAGVDEDNAIDFANRFSRTAQAKKTK